MTQGWHRSDLKFTLKYLFVYLPALLFLVIGSSMLQYAFLDPHPGYRAFTAASARAGREILIVAATVLVLDLAAIVTYMIRHGTKGDSEGSAVKEGPLPLDVGVNLGRSKRKILVQRDDSITMKSLVRGTATFGDRMLVLGLYVWLASFFSVFLGAGLILMDGLAILALVPVIPALFIYTRFVSGPWKDYRAERAKFRKASPARHRATSP